MSGAVSLETDVDFAVLTSLASGLKLEAEQLDGDLSTLKREIDDLRASWSGAAQEAFSLQAGYFLVDATDAYDRLMAAAAAIDLIRAKYESTEESVVAIT